MLPAKRARQDRPRPTLGGLGTIYSWSDAAVVKPKVVRATVPMRPPREGVGVLSAFACKRLSRSGTRPGRTGEYPWHCARRLWRDIVTRDTPRKPIVFWAKPLDPLPALPYQTPSPCSGFVRGSAFVRKNSNNRG